MRHRRPTLLSKVSLTAFLVAVPALASAQGIANGIVRFTNDIFLSFSSSWGINDNFTSTRNGESANGYLYSESMHGAPDSASITGSQPWDKSTTSSGDAEEITNQRVVLIGQLQSTIYASLESEIFSDSSASSGTTSHYAASYAIADVMQSYSLTRRPGVGIIDPPMFYTSLLCPAGAVELKTTAEGNARAFASIKVSIVGTIQSTRPGAEGPLTDLDPVAIFEKTIGPGDDQWASPLKSSSYALSLPNWARHPGAKFDLSMGLRLDMWTWADAAPVPEPASAVVLAIGALAISRRRTKKGPRP